jgi:hypothetical protein
MYSSTLTSTSMLDGVGGQRHAPTALTPGKTRYLLYRMLGVSKGQCGRVRKISPPPGFDPRTFQPVASCFTDCAIPSAIYTFKFNIIHSAVCLTTVPQPLTKYVFQRYCDLVLPLSISVILSFY